VTAPWLTIVGIGEGGLSGLSAAAKDAISGAEIVFGGVRHLELAKAAIRGEARQWLSPFSAATDAVIAEKGRDVCVLASGDPFHYGVGATLSRLVDPAQMRTIPHASAFSLAAARLGWPLQDVISLSLHGRPIDLIRRHLHAGSRILALTSDEHGPAAIAELLTQAGFGRSIITVMEALDGVDERIQSQMAELFALSGINPLNICAITVVPLPGARVLPLTPGLDDGLFEHDGQITKRDIRALTSSALAPRRHETLWDIGAGSGSIGIEWMLADPSLRTIAIEPHAERAARIARNACNFGVPNLRVVEGKAPEALTGLEPPHAIFVGGGGSDPGVMETALTALRPNGRLVANAVTLEMEQVLLELHAKHGGELKRIAVSQAEALGSMTGWRPAMPITQWRWTKP